MTEDDLHVEAVKLLVAILPQEAVVHHSPNEGKRGWKAQAKLKRLKTVAGWPDIEIVYCGRVYFLELKLEKYRNHKNGGLTENQADCHAKLRRAGCQVATCYTVDEVEGTVKAWMPVRGSLVA